MMSRKFCFLLFLLFHLAIGAGSAQTIETVYRNDEGFDPNPRPVRARDGNLYGTTRAGGQFGAGTIFKLTPAGVLATVHHFAPKINFLGGRRSELVETGLCEGNDGALYGTTEHSIYRFKTDGTFETLHEFELNFESESHCPSGELVKGKDGWFYGVTSRGGKSAYGSIFKISPKGVFKLLFSFTSTDGRKPVGPLWADSDGSFYGVTADGGTQSNGTVFRLTSTGGFKTLLSCVGYDANAPVPQRLFGPSGAVAKGKDGWIYFAAKSGGSAHTGGIGRVKISGQNEDVVEFRADTGSHPVGGFSKAPDGSLFGVTQKGGSNGNGAVYQFSVAQTLTSVVPFAGGRAELPGGLFLDSDGKFYGTTRKGGSGSGGTVFSTTSSGQMTTVATFAPTHGRNINGLIKASDGNLYGTTTEGGEEDLGTVFRVSPSGVLTTLDSFRNGQQAVGGLTEGDDAALYGMSLNPSTALGKFFKVATDGQTSVVADLDWANNGYVTGRLLKGSDGNFYGTSTARSSPWGVNGKVFRLTPSGERTTLHSFLFDGPGETLIERSGSLYGVTNNETVFQLTLEGEFTEIHRFAFTDYYYSGDLAEGPDGSLLLNAVNTYGESTPWLVKVSTAGVVELVDPIYGARFRRNLLADGEGGVYGAEERYVSEDASLFRASANGEITRFGRYAAATLANSLLDFRSGDDLYVASGVFAILKAPGVYSAIKFSPAVTVVADDLAQHITVSYTIPEGMQLSSAELLFDGGRVFSENHTQVFTSARLAAGTHTFSFRPSYGWGFFDDGTYSVQFKCLDSRGVEMLSARSNVTLDFAAPQAILISPHSSSDTIWTQWPAPITFSLPGDGRNVRIELEYALTTHRLSVPLTDTSLAAGEHTISFAPGGTADVPPAQGPLYAGPYHIYVSYEDTSGRPRVFSEFGFVTVPGPARNVITPELRAGGVAEVGVFVFQPSDDCQVGLSYRINGGAEQESPLRPTVRDENGNASDQFTITGLEPGREYTLRSKTVNSYGTAFSEPFVFTTPETSVLASGKGAIPGAGFAEPRIPAGSVWDSFGIPSINENGDILVLAKFRSGAVRTTAIIGWNLQDPAATTRVVAKVGDSPADDPSLIYTGFKEPVLGPTGSVAFIAKLAKAPGAAGRSLAKDSGLFFDADGRGPGHAVPIARRGSVAPQAGLARFDSVNSFALGSGAIFYTARLQRGIGGVSAENDTGLWSYDISTDADFLALRKDAEILDSRIKTFDALPYRTLTAGDGRGVATVGAESFTPFRITLADGRQAVGRAVSDGSIEIANVGEDSTSKFEIPTQNSAASLIYAKDGHILAEDDAEHEALDLEIGIAPTHSPLNGVNRTTVFSYDAGMVRTDESGDPIEDGWNILIGGDAYGMSGAKFKKMTSLALSEGSGAIFTATLKGKSVTTQSDVGLWAADSVGLLHLLLREGDQIGDFRVRNFTVLASVPNSPAQTRSFNRDGDIVVRITDTTGKQHIVLYQL